MSNELNHASIVTGAKLSGATVKVFKHNSQLLVKSSIVRQSRILANVWYLTRKLGGYLGISCFEIRHNFNCYT